MGAHLNAYTSREQTVYYAKCFKKDLENCERCRVCVVYGVGVDRWECVVGSDEDIGIQFHIVRTYHCSPYHTHIHTLMHAPYTCVPTHPHTNTHMHTYTHTLIHPYTHTHTSCGHTCRHPPECNPGWEGDREREERHPQGNGGTCAILGCLDVHKVTPSPFPLLSPIPSSLPFSTPHLFPPLSHQLSSSPQVFSLPKILDDILLKLVSDLPCSH